MKTGSSQVSQSKIYQSLSLIFILPPLLWHILTAPAHPLPQIFLSLTAGPQMMAVGLVLVHLLALWGRNNRSLILTCLGLDLLCLVAYPGWRACWLPLDLGFLLYLLSLPGDTPKRQATAWVFSTGAFLLLVGWLSSSDALVLVARLLRMVGLGLYLYVVVARLRTLWNSFDEGQRRPRNAGVLEMVCGMLGISGVGMAYSGAGLGQVIWRTLALWSGLMMVGLLVSILTMTSDGQFGRWSLVGVLVWYLTGVAWNLHHCRLAFIKAGG